MKASHKGILATIAGITGANLALDVIRAKVDPMPKLSELGPNTDLYVFKPSKGGGRALVRVRGDRAEVRRIVGSPRQQDRIRAELAIVFPE